MPRPLHALCLDLDGTLTDTLDVCVLAFQDAIEAATGRRPTPDEVKAGFGATEEGILERLAGRRDPSLEERWHARYAELLARDVTGPFPGVRELLTRTAARGIRLAVVTGKGARSARHTLESFDLWHAFERVEAGGRLGSVKAERLRAIVADWDLDPATVAYVGDSPSDVRDARAAGVIAVAAGWARTTDPAALRAAAPDRCFDRFDAFARWVDEQPAPGRPIRPAGES